MGVKRARGFTLLEIIIVLAVAFAAIGYAAYRLMASQNAAIRESLQAEQMFAVKALFDAATAYADGRRYLYVSNQKIEITIAELADEHLLKASWQGEHAAGPGLTAFGQAYSITAIRTPSGRMRVAVTESGPPVARLRARYGLSGEAAWSEYKAALAEAYRHRFAEDTYVLTAAAAGAAAYAIIPVSSAGTPIALSAADIAVQPYPAAAPSSLAVMVVTSTARDDDAGDQTVASAPAQNTYSECELVHSTNTGQLGAATCPTGKVKVASLPTNYCLYTEAQLQQGTEAGNVVLTIEENVRSSDTACGGQCSTLIGSTCSSTAAGVSQYGCTASAVTPAVREAQQLVPWTAPTNSGTGTDTAYRRFNAYYVDTLYMAAVYLNGSKLPGGYQCAAKQWKNDLLGNMKIATGQTVLFATAGTPVMNDALCCVSTPAH